MNKIMRRAIILAAGRGSRLKNVAGDVPKCLAPMGATTLLERQIAALKAAGVDEVVVVTGYRAELIERVCGSAARCVENVRHAETNSLYSLWLAREFFGDGFVVMNGDVLFHPHLLAELLDAPAEDALLISYADPAAPLGDEEMKVVVRDGCVAEITKQMDGRMADGENVGVVKFGAAGARILVDLLDQRVAAGGLRDWAPRAFGDFARIRPLYAVGTRGYPWTEIDFPADYERAVSDILPAIDGERTVRLPIAAGVYRRATCSNASTDSASARSRSHPIPITSIRAGCTARRSTISATASRATPDSSSSPARSDRARPPCCRRCCAASTTRRRWRG
jgi:choline kinase